MPATTVAVTSGCSPAIDVDAREQIVNDDEDAPGEVVTRERQGGLIPVTRISTHVLRHDATPWHPPVDRRHTDSCSSAGSRADAFPATPVSLREYSPDPPHYPMPECSGGAGACASPSRHSASMPLSYHSLRGQTPRQASDLPDGAYWEDDDDHVVAHANMQVPTSANEDEIIARLAGFWDRDERHFDRLTEGGDAQSSYTHEDENGDEFYDFESGDSDDLDGLNDEDRDWLLDQFRATETPPNFYF